MSKVGTCFPVRFFSLIMVAPVRGCTRIQYQHAPSRRACGDTAASNCTAVSYCQVLLSSPTNTNTSLQGSPCMVYFCRSPSPLSITTGLSASRSSRLYVHATVRRAGNVCSQTHSLIRSESSPHQTWMPFSSSCCLTPPFQIHSCPPSLHSIHVLPDRRHRYHY